MSTTHLTATQNTSHSNSLNTSHGNSKPHSQQPIQYVVLGRSVPIRTHHSFSLDPHTVAFTSSCTTTPHEVYTTASIETQHGCKNELKMRGSKRGLGGNNTMQSLMRVRLFSFSFVVLVSYFYSITLPP